MEERSVSDGDEAGRTQQSIDEAWMGAALALTARAEAEGEVPVAAVLVRGEEIVGRGWNRNIAHCDPSAHAEIEALREAGRLLGNHRLINTTLYCTLEPCLMCAGALVHARVQRVVYAATDPKTGADRSVFDLLQSPLHNHRIEVTAGVLADQSSTKLSNFFRQRRAQAAAATKNTQSQ